MSMLNNLGYSLISMLGSLFLVAIILRFLLQVVRADFYNPISQAVVKITHPFLSPIRKIIPSIAGLDIASLVLAFMVSALLVVLKNYLRMGYLFFDPIVLTMATIQLISILLDTYFYALIIVVIASWVAPGSYSPMLQLLYQLTEPLCSRVRQVIPPVAGLDFSVMVILFLISFVENNLPRI